MATTERKPLLLDFEKPLAELATRIDQIRQLAEENGVDVSGQIRQLETRATQLREEIFSSLTPSQRLQVARHPRRPSTLDYIQSISDEWMELHGDRCGGDDPALVGGVGRIAGQPVMMLDIKKAGILKITWLVTLAWLLLVAIVRLCASWNTPISLVCQF